MHKQRVRGFPVLCLSKVEQDSDEQDRGVPTSAGGLSPCAAGYVPVDGTRFVAPAEPQPMSWVSSPKAWVAELNQLLQRGLADHALRPEWDASRTTRGGEILLALQVWASHRWISPGSHYALPAKPTPCASGATALAPLPSPCAQARCRLLSRIAAHHVQYRTGTQCGGDLSCPIVMPTAVASLRAARRPSACRLLPKPRWSATVERSRLCPPNPGMSVWLRGSSKMASGALAPPGFAPLAFAPCDAAHICCRLSPPRPRRTACVRRLRESARAPAASACMR